MPGDIDLIRAPRVRYFICTCGWTSEKVPYGHSLAPAGAEAARHATTCDGADE